MVDAQGKGRIGEHIRRLRLEQHRTLEDVAAECGFTKSLLSKIETGKISPPLDTLQKIALALGTKSSLIVADGLADGPVHTMFAEVTERMAPTAKGYLVYPFATGSRGKTLRPFYFQVEKGKVKPHSISHTGEEFVFVLEGTIKFTVGGTTYTLHEGDSLFFNAISEHGVDAVTDVARYIGVYLNLSSSDQ